MTYLNQFHKEAVERKLRKIEESMKSPMRHNFPMPSPTDEQKQRIEQTAQAIIEARKLYPDKSLADMYGENMYLYPEFLTAHQNNERAVMQAYGFPVKSTFTESHCVAELFKLYKERIPNDM